MQSPKYIAYRCRSCKEWCLNERVDSTTRHRECNPCHRVPDLDHEPIDELHPELVWTVDLDLEFPAFSPAATSSSGASIRERSESPSRRERSEREYGVSCESERFAVKTSGGGRD
jgi:hypothetical protein